MGKSPSDLREIKRLVASYWLLLLVMILAFKKH